MYSIKNVCLFSWLLRLLDSRMIPVFVAFIVTLFGNYTAGILWMSFMFVSTTIY